MKLVITLALVAFVAAHPDGDLSRFEDFDSDEIVNNIRLLVAQVKCFLGTGRCTAEFSDVKKWLPDGVQTQCDQCSEKQKILVARVIKALMEKLPEEWKQLNKLHNPDGKYDEAIEKFVEQYGQKKSSR